MDSTTDTIESFVKSEYKYGFVSDIETDVFAPGLSEEVVRRIWERKGEPEFMLEWRLKAYRHWLTMTEPHWPNVKYPPIDYQAYIYYSAPKPKKKLGSLDEVDPELRKTFDKLGISLDEQKRLSNVAVDAVLDSASVATTFREELARQGIIFCSFNEAVKNHPELVKKYLGTVVPHERQFFCGVEFGRFQRRLVLLRAQRGAVPDGAVDLFPHEHGRGGAIRAHAADRRRGQLRELPGRMHGADARRQPVARGGGGVDRAGQRRDQILDGAELVSGRRGGQGRHLQFRHQARQVRRAQFEDFLDAGGNRLGHHLEISERDAAGRQLGG